MTIKLEYEMTYSEVIAGPLPVTEGSPFGDRLCWQVASGTLKGPRIDATIAMPGIDWMRLGPDGIRRQDLRAQLLTADGAAILFHYSVGLIRPSDRFMTALREGGETAWDDQYMRMVPEFIVGDARYSWLNESIFLARGRISGSRQIEYEIFRVE